MRSFVAVSALLLAAAVCFTASPAHAQVFGKNKVQYESLDWSEFETPHVRLHYYAQEESLARQLTAFAESVTVEYDRRFRLEPRHQVPILLYSTHHLFEQTNVTPGFVSEGTGGFTELIKGRVLIPHTGSWSRLRWVTRHELTHWYMLEKLTVVMRAHRRTQGYMPPLWFTEGLAEFCGTQWDEDAEGLLRDAVVSGEAMPLTRSDEITGTVLMYKEGQSFLLYLAEHYGRDKVFDLLDNWYRGDDFETVFRITLGVSLKEVDRQWFAEMRRRYYPTVASSDPAPDAAQRLTPRGRYNLGPRVLPNANPADTTLRFCYFEAGENGIDLMINEPGAKGRRRAKHVLSGGQSPSFESFHLFLNRPDASTSGLIALSSKRGGRDALYVVDSRNGHVVHRFAFPQLVSLTNPSLVPGDTAMVFSAQDYDGQSDLYRVNWSGGHTRLERLTHDGYDDQEPDVSPDGKWVVFASDRCERAGHYSLYRIALEGGHPLPVSDPATGDDRQPVYSPDGKWIAYRSTRAGTSDLWVRSSEPSNQARRVTHLIGPASDPDWMPDNRGLLFTGQNAITFQTYRHPFDPETLAVDTEAVAPRAPALALETYGGPTLPYQRRLGFDLVQNAVQVDPGLGTSGGGGQIALSDMLGNEQFYISLSNDADRFGNFWDSFEGGVTYINRARRLNYGVGIFRLTQLYDADLDARRIERRVGIEGLASYPFDKFNRIEGSVLVRHANNHLLRDGEFKSVDLVSNFLTLVHDNSRWSYLGPAAGTRAFVAAGYTRDMSSGAADFGTVVGEVRHYFTPLPQVVSATRIQGQSSVGRDAQRFYLGGRNTVRGYDPRALSGLRTALIQQEFRFPLVRGLTLAVPATWTLPTISGALFADMGWAWDQGDVTLANFSGGDVFYYNSGTAGGPGHLGAVGAGFFIGGGYFPSIRWNYAWPTTDFRSFTPRPRTQFSIGFNF